MNSRTQPYLLFALLATSLTLCSVRGEDKKPTDSDLQKLQGEWTMISGLADGSAVSEQMLQSSKRVCKGDETTVIVGGQLIMRAKFKIDASKKPKTIDYDVLEGPAKGGKMLGIYELEGDTVKFCFGAPGNERPAAFSSQLGERRTFSVWQRKREPAPKAAEK